MDPSAFNKALSSVLPVGLEASAAEQQPPVVDPMVTGATPEQERRPDGTLYSEQPNLEPGLGDPSGLDAIAGGSLKSVFETKDFLFGDTPEDDRSEFRENVEETVDLRGDQSLIDGVMAEVSQFATAMVGLGKAKHITKLLPWVGGITLGKKAKVGVEVGQAALAGAIAFDPHEEKLSNLIQGTFLANPFNEWLAADPTDSAAEGRLKAALESIGMDAVLLGVFMTSGRILKHLKRGDVDTAEKEALRLEQEAAEAIDAEDTLEAEPDAVLPEDTGLEPEAVSEGLPKATSEEIPEFSAEPQLPKATSDEVPEIAAKTDGDLVEVEVVGSTTEAKANAGLDTGPSPRKTPIIKFNDEDTDALLAAMDEDVEAIRQHGGWYQAIENGHTFGKGEGIPYRKLNSEAEVDDFMARVVDASEERLDAVKGGKVLKDKRVETLVGQRAKLFDDDPALLIGMLQKAGRDASHMVADMEAGYLVATKMFQDSYALAARINVGDFVEAGSKQEAVRELKHRLSLAASVYGASKSMSSNAGRALRRMRSDFKIEPEAVEALNNLDGDALAELIISTKGDPRSMAKLANPSTWSKVTDFMSFVYVNNLVSGPMTQFINASTNAYMLGARPLERMLGSIVTDAVTGSDSRAILRESTKQYVYMASAFSEGFRNAARAFVKNDSFLTPHKSEVYAGSRAGERSGALGFKKWDSIPNILYNSMAALPLQAIGTPTRVLGTVDELMKQTTYRSKVMAGAYWEGVEEAHKTGLKGKQLDAFVNQYVTDKVHAAFDAEGRGVNANALNEANIATFQQDLLPKTLGKWFQTGTATHPAMRLVLPFVKTPTNVIRYGWKMTPGLNALQTEYRQMLKGELGEEAQRQAVGQMTLGSLFIGSAAMLASQGRITGAGPSDYKARSSWMSAGGVPYSVWFENDDGSVTSVPFNRFDPIAIPFGIIADLQDVMTAQPEGVNESEVEAVIGALSMSVASQMRNKTYLMGISQAMDAFMEPERSNYGSQVAANFLPFSAAQRQFNSDPYLREARTMTDKLMSTVPGLSDKVPARYDAFGDPITTRKGLWSNKEHDVVDIEVMRLAIENGSTIVRPHPSPNGVDLRDITMSDGRNAFEAYQQLAGHPEGKQAPSLKAVIKQVMESEAYRSAPDGDTATRGTKLWILHGPLSRFRGAALRVLKTDPVVREAFLAKLNAVKDHHSDPEAASGRDARAGLEGIGAAFGVDLKALTGPAKRPNTIQQREADQ